MECVVCIYKVPIAVRLSCFSGFVYSTCVVMRHSLLLRLLRSTKKYIKSIKSGPSWSERWNMKAERGLSINNPNESWLESKGTWFTYVLLITIGHLVILSIPFFDTPTAWTLTNIFHNLVGWGFDPCSFCLFVAIISGEKICELFVIIEYIDYVEEHCW